MNYDEMKAAVRESQWQYHPGGMQADERILRLIGGWFDLLDVLPALAKKKSVQFLVGEGGGLTFGSEEAEMLFKILKEDLFELMQSSKGARFHPLIEALFAACQQRPLAMKIFYELKTNEEQASTRYNSFDVARALQDIVELLSMAFASYVVKAQKRDWHTRIRKGCERVELFLDGLVKQENAMILSSFSCVQPHVKVTDSQLLHIPRDKEGLISAIEARLGRHVRGVVVRTTVTNEGLRFDLLLVASNSVSPGMLNQEMQQIWREVTQGAGRMYCLDSMRSSLCLRKIDESADVPPSEHRRRLAVYFGMADSLVYWEVLGVDTLSVVELREPSQSWPFPAGRSSLVVGLA